MGLDQEQRIGQLNEGTGVVEVAPDGFLELLKGLRDINRMTWPAFNRMEDEYQSYERWFEMHYPEGV